MTVIFSAQKYSNNSQLIGTCFDLGYLKEEWLTLDPTYGEGVFWKGRRPKTLVQGDLYTWQDDPTVSEMDFRNLAGIPDDWFDAVVYDPPYKFNGTPSAADIRYGVDVKMRWQDRLLLMKQGQKECARVLKPKGFLLTKCQDQVVSGKNVWQTDIMTRQAEHDGLRKVDVLLYLRPPRDQTHERQVHSRRNYSSLLVFKKL